MLSNIFTAGLHLQGIDLDEILDAIVSIITWNTATWPLMDYSFHLMSRNKLTEYTVMYEVHR